MTRADDDRTQPRRRRGARRWPWLVVAGTIAVVAALVVFQPWKLVVDEVVDEALPVALQATTAASAAGSPATTPSPPAASAGPASPTTGATPAAPRVLARGVLISHEHATSGTVVVLALADGRRVLRLQDLRTSNGPDVKVWLSDAVVRPGSDGWRVFDDGRYADLGSLKGNVGNQNYVIPADVDLATLSSLSLWCDRFDVSFGAATLTPV
jgi:hypothetical protein